MPRSRRRAQPRHLDPERLRLTRPSRPVAAGLLGVATVLAVLGVSVLSGGAVSPGSTALKADQVAADAAAAEQTEADKASPDAPSASDSASASDSPPDDVAKAPTFYRLVEAVHIKRAPKPEVQARLTLAERAEKQQAAEPSIPDFGVAMLNGIDLTPGSRDERWFLKRAAYDLRRIPMRNSGHFCKQGITRYGPDGGVAKGLMLTN